ncbi:8-oxo-dGTP pyrophosphatase MutT (NUDIX family) [Rhodoblastus sphagnicola]|uniref:NUDIX hydrolase n=1 Tax=Rhodoblastus sphagnicola TaxID=333368 RepID=UPI0017CE264B|nr:NUDIX hydrolase [Rhodoblastus sphagnicola]MBB4196274.1 8-oxo-dGTP pyrophosphatase MutT (NUDIX family) [Rhodoblastus sphagnicola]
MKNSPRPRDAAALVLIDGKGKKARVLLGKRNPALKFIPGKYVFPGGRLERGDRAMTVAGPLDARDEARLMQVCGKKGEDFARALALAAIRECFEETGIALGVSDYGGPARPPACWRTYGAHGLLPDLGGLHFCARAVTPPMLPRRFDARFFVADAKGIAARVEGVCHSGAELTELVWAPLDRAESYDLPDITLMVLQEVRARFDGGLSRFSPVPHFHHSRGVWRRDLL